MNKVLIMMSVFLVTSFASAKEINVKVNGMVCSMCAQGIQKKFTSIGEVKDINVDLDNKIVKINTKDDKDLEDKQIRDIITEAGYNVASIEENKLTQNFFSWFGLFSSFGTLICCAIPSTLVLLGFGATLASFLGNFPQLIWLSENKGYVFGLSFIMLGISYIGQKYSETKTCPIDRKEDCEQTKDWSKPLFWISLSINLVGSFYAFVLPRLLY